MTSPAVQFNQLDSVPLAVIRRQASASELSRVVPECCGLVWNAVRAQQARAGRHVAIYWDGGIRLEQRPSTVPKSNDSALHSVGIGTLLKSA